MAISVISGIIGIAIAAFIIQTGGPAFGAALLAWAADHPGVPLKDLTEGVVNAERRFTPDRELAVHYENKYLRYMKIHDAVCDI